MCMETKEYRVSLLLYIVFPCKSVQHIVTTFAVFKLHITAKDQIPMYHTFMGRMPPVPWL